MKQYSC